MFNVVVGMGVLHFLTIGVEEEAVPEGLVMMIHRMASFLYSNDGLIASMRP